MISMGQPQYSTATSFFDSHRHCLESKTVFHRIKPNGKANQDILLCEELFELRGRPVRGKEALFPYLFDVLITPRKDSDAVS